MNLEEYFRERISENTDEKMYILYSDPLKNVRLVSC